jgi:hypothetical protein
LWERWQLSQFGQTQQLSCNPALYFAQAMLKCPQALRMHFPCDPTKLDYDYCTGKFGGMVVDARFAPELPRAYIEAAGEWDPEEQVMYEETFILRFSPKLTWDQIQEFPASFRNQLIWGNSAIRYYVPSVDDRKAYCKKDILRIVACQKGFAEEADKGTCGTIVDCEKVGEHPILQMKRFDKLVVRSLEPFECAFVYERRLSDPGVYRVEPACILSHSPRCRRPPF